PKRRGLRDHGHLQQIVADLDLIAVAEPRLAARAERPSVHDDGVLRTGVRDDVAAGLEGDRGVRARDEAFGVGEHQRVALASPDGAPGALEAGRDLAVEWPPLEGDRADRQHNLLPFRNKSESGVEGFYSGSAARVPPQSAVLRRLRKARLLGASRR